MKAFGAYPFTPTKYQAKPVSAKHVPVLIVGGGPVGLTSALALAKQGIKVVVCEADDSVCAGSRAICISRRSLEIFQRLGVVDKFLQFGLPWTGGRSYYQEHEVLHFHMPHDQHEQLPPMINVAQYHIEDILLQACLQEPLCEIRWQSKVSYGAQTEQQVAVQVETPLGEYQQTADFLIACDGGRSSIRESMGLKLLGTSYEGRYIIVDILLQSDRATERLAYFDPRCNRGSTVLVHKQPHGVWRIDYQLQADEDPVEAVKAEAVLPRVQSLLEMMGEKADWQPIWISMYKANALSMERYHHGRVVFAGDAAHLLPIFGVRGANSGIDDADNLALKLAHTLAHPKQDLEPLALYSIERVAAAQENLRQAMKSTDFMAPPSHAFALLRTAVLSLAQTEPRLRSLINPRQTTAIHYPKATPYRETCFYYQGQKTYLGKLLAERYPRDLGICFDLPAQHVDDIVLNHEQHAEVFSRYHISTPTRILIRADGYIPHD
ncbi:MAG: hypothetical protein RLZZ502_483 [Pseudomonadota bacterium]